MNPALPPALAIDVLHATAVAQSLRDQIIDLCSEAFGQDMRPYLRDLGAVTHVVARHEGVLVAHAAWVTRRLQAGALPLMRTAYVEMVATAPAWQRRGIASAVMRRLHDSVTHYDLAALSPTDDGAPLYERLGWQTWRGPLFIRGAHELIPTPGERIMVLPLASTPPLDLDAMLTAEWRPGELW